MTARRFLTPVFSIPGILPNPYPYYRILRGSLPCLSRQTAQHLLVTRYDDITECYFDDEGFNTIPKGSSSGVLGNTQLELSGVEHRRRRNLYGQHLVGQSLNHRIPAIEHLAQEMIDHWDTMAADGSQHAEGSDFVKDENGREPWNWVWHLPTSFRFAWYVKCWASLKKRNRSSSIGTTP